MSAEPINLNVDITTLSTEDKAKLYRRIRELRLSTERWLAPVEVLEKNLKEALIADIPKSSEGIVFVDADGKRRVMTVTSKSKPTIGDWQLLLEQLKKHDRFDLLQKRLAERAVMDIDGWEKIPGIEVFNALGLSDTAL